MDLSEPGRRRLPTVPVVAGLLALLVTALVVGSVASGAAPVRALPGLPDAGLPTGWALRLAEAAALVAAVLTTGSLLVPAVLLGAAGVGAEPAVVRRAARAAARSAAAWLVASVATAMLVVADARAVEPWRLLLDDASWTTLVATAPGAARGQLLAATAAATVLVLASRTRTRRDAAWACAVTLLGLLPPQLAGHAAADTGQDVVATGVVVHALAAAVWVGGLAGLLLHLRRTPALHAAALARFSPLAGAAYAALAVSGAATASAHLSTWSAWSSGYGALVLAKVVLLALLGWCGLLHRRLLRRGPAHGSPGGSGARGVLVRLGLAEVALMAVAGGLAAALSRTPPPVVAAPAHGAGHPGLPAVVEPVTPWLLVAAVRPNALALLVVGGLLVAHRTAVRRHVARGEAWPESRSRAATAAAVLAVAVLCSGLATYAPAMLSVQVLQLLLMLLVVPAVVVRAAPALLVGRPADPVVGSVAVCGLLVLVYRTPLLELSQRSHWVHLTLLLAAAAAGTLHLSATSPHGGGGEQAVPEARGSAARLAPLVPPACLGVLGAQLLLGDRLVAGTWFLELRWGWVDPAADQRLAGMIALAAAALLLATALLRPARPRVDAAPQRRGQIRTSTSPSRSSAGTGP